MDGLDIPGVRFRYTVFRRVGGESGDDPDDDTVLEVRSRFGIRDVACAVVCKPLCPACETEVVRGIRFQLLRVCCRRERDGFRAEL